MLDGEQNWFEHFDLVCSKTIPYCYVKFVIKIHKRTDRDKIGVNKMFKNLLFASTVFSKFGHFNCLFHAHT